MRSHSPYANRELTDEDIESLRLSLTATRGYATSRATVLDQDFSGNFLIVQIIEDRLAKQNVLIYRSVGFRRQRMRSSRRDC